MTSNVGQDNAANCTICAASFKTLQECLAHELLKHTIMTQKKLPKCLGAVSKLSASEQTQSERRLLEELLVQSPPGQQLKAVLSFYAGNSAELEQCFQEVSKTIQDQLHGKVTIYPFGSFVTGLALKDSDIDLYLKSIDGNSNELYEKTNRLLRHTGGFSDVIAIRNARVPIIRFKHVASGLSVDINMSHSNGAHNSRFVAKLLKQDVRLRELFLFIKIWAKKLLIIGKVMTSYCLITLIIYQLQQQRHLPSIKELQSGIPVFDVGGINYAYNLEHVPALPDFLTTFDLISGFFELYSHMDFKKKMLSPYLGHALDVEAAGNFPEYNAQVLAIETAMQERIKPFNVESDVFVQDPFELSRNVGQSISKTGLFYLNQCLAAANEACNDAKLKSTPHKLYDYLLFGLAEHLVQEHRLDHVLPAKQRQQMPKKEVKTADAVAVAVAVAVADAVAVEAMVDVASTTVAAKADESSSSSDDKKSTVADNSSMPLMLVYTLTPTNNDVKTLYSDFVSKDTKSINYIWATINVNAIRNILLFIYGLRMKESESDANVSYERMYSYERPLSTSLQISSTLDLWSGRNFPRSTTQSFFSQQMQQTDELRKTRPLNPSYVVNMRGHLSLIVAEDYKELRLELQPMPGDVLGLQRNSPLTKFFTSLKTLLHYYNLKERVISFEYKH